MADLLSAVPAPPPTTARAVRVAWAAATNEHGDAMLWFGSWLLGNAGEEGPWFYSGRGGETTEHAAPGGMTGMRIRRWPSEGFWSEYVDLAAAELAAQGAAAIRTGDLRFDRPQPFSRLEAIRE